MTLDNDGGVQSRSGTQSALPAGSPRTMNMREAPWTAVALDTAFSAPRVLLHPASSLYSKAASSRTHSKVPSAQPFWKQPARVAQTSMDALPLGF